MISVTLSDAPPPHPDPHEPEREEGGGGGVRLQPTGALQGFPNDNAPTEAGACRAGLHVRA